MAAELSSSEADTRQNTTPTLLELMEMKRTDGEPLNVIETIASGNYKKFGMYLLGDKNGKIVAVLKRDHINDGVESITEAILQKWLDSPSCTYQHLIDCLKQSDLGALAELIEQALGICCSDLTSKVPKNAGSAVDDIASYASYLKEKYNYISQELTAQHWSHLPQCEYIQLAMIDCKRKRHEVEEEEKRERLAHEGKVEPILNTKETIELDHLFAVYPLVVVPPPFLRVILLEAAPGGGKSTLALHICHQWAQGVSFLERYDIVVLAYLRDGAIQDAKHLADILPADVLVSRKQIASEIIACRGKNVLFIFDGWDEFPSKLRHSSVISDIIQKSYELPLDHCTILITSRSESSLDLHDIANRRVEILGFTLERIHEYIHKALVKNDGNDTRVHKLVEHLEDHPVIESYCYVPLHAAILVHIFLTKSGVLPSTLHELFSEFILCCIVRELKTHDKITFQVSSLEKLPDDDLICKLNDLRVLAYKGVMQSKAFFYEEDLLKFQLEYPLKLKTFGLLESVEGLTVSSTSISYNFLHLSIQEHLAAYYISKMSPTEQVEVFKHLFQGHEQSRFQAVLLHYSGFTKLNNSAIQHFISTYSEHRSSIEDILPLLHCFYEAQRPSLCKLVGPEFRNIKLEWLIGFVPIDYLVIGYFITSLLFTSDVCLTIRDIDWRSLELLLVELCKQGDNKELSGRLQLVIYLNYVMKTLRPARGLKKEISQYELLLNNLQQLPFINDLTIEGDIEKHEMQVLTDLLPLNKCHLTKLQIINYKLPDTVQSITAVLHSTKLTHLNLSGTLISDEGACCVFRCLQYNRTLLNLNLSDIGIKFTDSTVQELLSMLKINKTLTHLDLSNNHKFLASGAGYLFQGLQHNTALVHLNLSSAGIEFDIFTAKMLSTMLQVNKTLMHLDLSIQKKIQSFPEDSLVCMLQGLQLNTSLVYLNLSNTSFTFTPVTTQALATMLQVNKALTHLDLSRNVSICNSISCIWEALMHNTTLTHLNLSRTLLKFNNQALTIMLQVNKTLTHLDLSHNDKLTDSEARCICLGLQHNTALVSLNLSWTNLIGGQSFATMLSVNKTLTHLDLSFNTFTDSGVHCVCQGLQYNTALLHLNLSWTNLTDEGAEYIAQALHSNRSLQTLDISDNKTITDDGFALIAESLKTNKTLKTLYINDCSITLIRLAKTVYQAKFK